MKISFNVFELFIIFFTSLTARCPLSKNMSNPTKRPNGCASQSAFVASLSIVVSTVQPTKGVQVSTSTNTA